MQPTNPIASIFRGSPAAAAAGCWSWRSWRCVPRRPVRQQCRTRATTAVPGGSPPGPNGRAIIQSSTRCSGRPACSGCGCFPNGRPFNPRRTSGTGKFPMQWWPTPEPTISISWSSGRTSPPGLPPTAGRASFPIKDIRYWRDYITGTVKRYHKDVKYWEVWNEFNGSFGDSKNKVKDYARLVVTAYDAAKKVDPTAKLGLSVANFDVGFLDAVIKAGAGDHFDFICVHPYENLGAVAEGGEMGYLSLAGNLRKMLAANKQRKDIPLWITEIGFQAPIKPEPKGDAQQADMLAKAYLLSLAQGFERIFWFEARGPSYGHGTDHGIIHRDWTPRPAYDALQAMTTLLGQAPRYLGWLDVGKGGYGFLFKGQKGNVLAAWSPAGKKHKTKFDADVRRNGSGGQAVGAPGRTGTGPDPASGLHQRLAGRPGQAGAGQRRKALSVGRGLWQRQGRHLPVGGHEYRGRPQASQPKDDHRRERSGQKLSPAGLRQPAS